MCCYTTSTHVRSPYDVHKQVFSFYLCTSSNDSALYQNALKLKGPTDLGLKSAAFDCRHGGYVKCLVPTDSVLRTREGSSFLCTYHLRS